MVDYIIIGQGLAGSVMAMTLIEKGKSVMVFDSPKPNTSSSVAAGIMNPITGKRMALTWMADDFFEEAHRFYTNLEGRLQAEFFYPSSIYRIFSSVSEQNDWMGKADEARYKSFASSDQINNIDNPAINNPFGSMEVKGGGRLDVPTFLEVVKKYLSEMSAYNNSEVCESEMEYINDHWVVHGLSAQNVVSCTGANAWIWDFLPFTPVKGEVLEVEATNLNFNSILVGGCFVSPIANKSTYYAGATYNWDNLDTEISEEGKQDILHRMKKFVQTDVKVVSHRAGIRPTVHDRRPLVGKHPKHKNLYLLGGFGSKGVSMAPLLAESLFQTIENGTTLPDDMNLERFL